MGLKALHGPGSGENPHGAFKRGAEKIYISRTNLYGWHVWTLKWSKWQNWNLPGVANEGVSVIEGVGVMRGNQYASTFNKNISLLCT